MDNISQYKPELFKLAAEIAWPEYEWEADDDNPFRVEYYDLHSNYIKFKPFDDLVDAWRLRLGLDKLRIAIVMDNDDNYIVFTKPYSFLEYSDNVIRSLKLLKDKCPITLLLKIVEVLENE